MTKLLNSQDNVEITMKSRRMRILYCTDTLMAGGTEQQLVELISGLDFEKYEVYVICLYSYQANRSLHFLPQLINLNIPVINFDLGWNTKSKLLALWLFIREIWKIHPQIVQAVNYHSNLFLRLACPFLPSIHIIGCIFVPYSRHQLWYERISNWLCDSIVCNSKEVVDQLKQFAPHSHIIHIPNGINLQKFTAHYDKGSTNQRVLLFMGRICQQKSPHLIVEALGKLAERGDLAPDIRLWLVGEREDEILDKHIDILIAKYSLENFVVRCDATNTPEIFFDSSYVVVVPSLWEGLPGVVLEALAMGCPIIISDAANRAEVVIEGHNGWMFRTGDIEQLVDVLSYALSLPCSVIQGMASACRNSILEYDANHMVEKYIHLYESL